MDHLYDELTTADERTLRFNPLGLGSRLLPRDAVRFQAGAIARATLVDAVPDHVRENFERLRKLHLYGVLEYEFFSVAVDNAFLVLEAALRARFVSYYTSGIPLECRGGRRVLHARSFEEVRAARSDRWQLSRGASAEQLPIGLGQLLDWARREGLLPGRRTIAVDRALASLRNYAAHPVSYTLHMPLTRRGR